MTHYLNNAKISLHIGKEKIETYCELDARGNSIITTRPLLTQKDKELLLYFARRNREECDFRYEISGKTVHYAITPNAKICHENTTYKFNYEITLHGTKEEFKENRFKFIQKVAFNDAKDEYLKEFIQEAKFTRFIEDVLAEHYILMAKAAKRRAQRHKASRKTPRAMSRNLIVCKSNKPYVRHKKSNLQGQRVHALAS